jgi:hypothetical protein
MLRSKLFGAGLTLAILWMASSPALADPQAGPPSGAAASADHQLQKSAQAPRHQFGYLGVRPVSLNKEIAPVFSAGDAGGALVWHAMIGSPAEQAGLKAGDVITSLDGRPVRGARALRWMVARHAPGDVVALAVLRQGQSQTINVRLGERPAPRPMMRAAAWRGQRQARMQAPMAGPRTVNRQTLERRIDRLQRRLERLRSLEETSR